MAKNLNRQIWENATPLGAAWECFAHPANAALLATMPGGLETFASGAEAVTGLADIFKAGHDALTAKSKRDAVILEMREELLDELFNANLIALAYRELPSVSSAPIAIAPEFFDCPEIHWDRDTAEYFGKRYNRIKVYDPNVLPKTAKPKIGRIGSGEAINSAIERLIASNPNFCALLRKTACGQIREILEISGIPGNGLSDQNLSKFILRKCPKRRINKLITNN